MTDRDFEQRKKNLSARRAKLSTTQQAVLERRLQGTDQDAPQVPIARVTRDEPLPLSLAQQRLWFLDQLEPGNAAYNISSAVRLQGTLDVSALERSLNEIRRRHETLRTTFTLHGEQPIQVIAPAAWQVLPCTDLSELTPPDREARARQLIAEEAQGPFDLTRGPLLRNRLLRLDDQDHILLVTMHHIISDGWSMGVMVRELTTLYRAFSAGQPSPLPELSVQYADYAVWQRQWLSGDTLTRQLTYWQQQFSGELPLLDLPTDRPRPPVQTFHGAMHTFQVPLTLTQQLLALGHKAGTTLFMTLLAAFQTLLYRYTGQTDLIIGTPIAHRTREETEGLIGFFVNTLALRVSLQGNPSFRQLLTRVREVTLGAYAHQDLSFDRLVDELHVPRDLSRTSLFQVMFVLQNAPMPTIDLPNLRLQSLEADTATAKLDLTLFITETAAGLLGQFNYNTDLFEAASIERLVEHYQILLAGLVADPERRLSELPLLTEAERQQELGMWNATVADYPRGQCVHELFGEQVERTPDAVAVVFEDQSLTYRELDRRTNQLAHHLRKLGVGPEVLVGICLERSLAMVIGLLAILKAGGAYVPLDPDYPEPRLAYMLADAQVAVLLTQASLRDRFPHLAIRSLCLDTDWPLLASEPNANPVSGVSASNLVYVIYTSGSTGSPKGVAIQHGQLSNYVHSISTRLNLERGMNYALVSAITTDLGNTVLFPALCLGGCLHIISKETAADSSAFQHYAECHTLDCLKITPSHFVALLASACASMLPRRRLILGGEASRWEWIQQIQALSPTCALFNHYGPTETTVGVVTYPIGPADHAQGSTVPIGRPLANTQIYLLDPHLNPVPRGVPGELHIGGAGLARGYLWRPELTAARFIPNPFSHEPGARLYKTGDLARYLPDGNLEFLGRIDQQVKLRGFRLELGEIEARLNQHPTIQQSAVIVREGTDGDKRLVAYVVAPDNQQISASELRRFLQDTLPDYMIPGAFVSLERLPLTPSGKIDRRALPASDALPAAEQESYVAPRTSLEEELAALWADILHLERVGIHDNFFAVGGHSLLATQIMTRITQRFQVTLPLQALFQSPTIAAIAEKIETLRWAAQAQVELTSSDQTAREEGEL